METKKLKYEAIIENMKKALVPTKAYSFNNIAREMKFPQAQNKELSAAIREACDAHVMFETQKGDYYFPKFEDKEIEVTIKVHSKGFAFGDVTVDLKDPSKNFSIFFTPNNIMTAMDGDLVRAKYFKELGPENKYQGFVTEIVKRYKTFLVGTVIKNDKAFDFLPLDRRIKKIFKFKDTTNLVHNAQVKAEIIEITANSMTIDVQKTLGAVDDVSMDILSEIIESGVPYEFPKNVLEAAKALPQVVTEEEIKKDKDGITRRDLRKEIIVTIDGDDTKDFDDAVTVKKITEGKWKDHYFLGVYIADVTYYVREKDPIDYEAYSRGTSVYLADRVIPMLPFELSNGICSLNPNVDRMVQACDMIIDQNGETVWYEIYPAVFKSYARLTYQECNRFYKRNTDQDATWKGEQIGKDDKLQKMLDEALELSKIIRKYKVKEGYVDFDIHESKIIIGADGTTEDIVMREREFSEMLIEDFMVRANECVAKNICEKELAFIYRVHEKPELERLQTLKTVVSVLGLDVDIPQVAEPRAFAEAIEQLKKTRFDDFMKTMMLRTMAKAIYSHQNVGHFGLASQYYTHFTSPIRRYPDLMVHRMQRAYLFTDQAIANQKKTSSHFDEILPAIGEHTSMTEQRAMDLERRVDEIKKAEFYESLVGQSFTGQVSTLKKFGFFVEFPNKVAGMVATNTLIDGAYELTTQGMKLESKNRSITIGDNVEVTVVGADKHEGKIDLVLTDMYEEWKKRAEHEIKRPVDKKNKR